MTTAPHLDPTTVAVAHDALRALAELSPSLVYATLLTDDGFPIGSTDARGLDGSRFASMSSAAQALGDAVARELDIGASEYLIISADLGNVVQMRVSRQPIVIAALFDDHETLGKSLAVTKSIARSVADQLASIHHPHERHHHDLDL